MNSLTSSRRSILRTLSILALQRPFVAIGADNGSPEQQFAGIERGIGIRLGIAAHDTGSGRRLVYRGSELFPMCSTFKFLLAACILERVDKGAEQLSKSILYTQNDLLEYAPVTRANVAKGWMTVAELCAAAIEVSDNTAANLLLRQIGGPTGISQFVRALGDEVTRLDRIEPELNTALPGDPRDTTSPAAMVDSMEKILLGDILSRASRSQLVSWLEQCATGRNRLRAGIPANWRAGDKTGTGQHGAAGDIGIFWPPSKPPVLMAAYLVGDKATPEQREQAFAAAGRVVVRSL